jgi:hypothetical protein
MCKNLILIRSKMQAFSLTRAETREKRGVQGSDNSLHHGSWDLGIWKKDLSLFHSAVNKIWDLKQWWWVWISGPCHH